MLSENPLKGQIVNINYEYNNTNNVQFTFDVVEDIANDLFESVVIFDGEVNQRTDQKSNYIFDVVLSGGNHSIDFLRYKKENELTDHLKFAYGNNVYLDWEQSQDTDIVAYNVYLNSVLIDTITQVEVNKADYKETISGGRFSVFGTTSVPVNDVFPVVFSGNSFVFDGVTYAFSEKESSYVLPYGINLILHDNPVDYSNFDLFIGVKNYVVLQDQPSGSNTYKICAVDQAGNESNAIEKTIYVNELPDEYVISFEEEVVLESKGANIDYVNIYADYAPDSNLQFDYINTDSKVGQLALEEDSIALPVGTKFYAFPVVNGLEYKDYKINTVYDVASGIGFVNTPVDLELTQLPNGTVKVSWSYQLLQDDAINRFNIVCVTDDDNFSYSKVINPTDIIFDNVLLFEHDIIGLNHGITLTVYVVPVDNNLVARDAQKSETLSIIVDAMAPVISGDLHGLNI